MKKIIISILSVILMFLLTVNLSYALSNDETLSTWAIDNTDTDITYIFSEKIFVDFTHIGMELWTEIHNAQNELIDDYTAESYSVNETTNYTHVRVYDDKTSSNFTQINFGESSTWGSELLYFIDEGSAYKDISIYYGKYIQICIALNPILSIEDINEILNVYNTNEEEAIVFVIKNELEFFPYDVKNEPENYINNWWHYVDGNQVFIHMNNDVYNINTNEKMYDSAVKKSFVDHWNYIGLEHEKWFDDYEWPNQFLVYKPSPLWNKLKIEVMYSSGTKELVYNGLIDHGIAFRRAKAYEYPAGTIQYYSWGIFDYNFSEGDIIQNNALFTSVYSKEDRNDEVVALRISFQNMETTEVNSVDQLPMTSGSIIGGNSTEIGTAYSIVNGNNAQIIIDYQNQTFNLEYSGIDTSFLEGVKKAIYYTYNSNKYLRFEYLDDQRVSSYAANGQNISDVKWVPFTDWNLSSNEIIFTNKVWTSSYLTKETGNNIYAYFYIPNLIYDNLIHVDMQFDYRYFKASFPDFWNNESLDIKTQVVSLDHDESTLTTPDWKKDLYSYVPIGMAIGAMIPGVRWPVLLIGSSLLALNYTSEKIEFMQKEINEIELANPNSDIVDSLEKSIETTFNKKIEIVTSSDKIYKLHLGQFDLYDNVEVIEGSEKLIGFVYETSGKLVYVNSNSIVSNFEQDDSLDTGNNTQRDLDDILKYVLYGFLVIFAAVILPNLNGMLNSISRIISSPKKMISLLVIIIVLLLLIGVI